MKPKFNAIYEHVLIPLFFVLAAMVLMALMYFVNELFKTDTYLREFYRFDAVEIDLYKRRTVYFIMALSASLLGLAFVLKYKNWLFSILWIVVNSILIVLCITYA